MDLTVPNPGFIHRNELVKCMDYVCGSFFTELEEVMVGLSNAPKEIKPSERSPVEIGTGTVVGELKTFGEKCKYLSPEYRPT